eukprot:TRINITY_DN3907_c0_g1_i1.p2 TRINITY_DN3907_c0_g1~~TRINITY_DN3907_c0_g1_i1.p2  ORF type:complete len:118 (-),score=4.28 TRINITY_DN3907_c0_g1_i1:306-659(-)
MKCRKFRCKKSTTISWRINRKRKPNRGLTSLMTSPKQLNPPKPESKCIINENSTLEKHVMMYYLQPGGARAKLSNEEKQNFLFKINNLSKESIAQYLNNALSSPDNSVAIVASLVIP